MDSETLDDKKPEAEEEEEKEVSGKENEIENSEFSQKEPSLESNEPEEEQEKDVAEESKEGEGSKREKRAPKGSSKKDQDSAEKAAVSERPTRERKVVERYSVPSPGRTPPSKGLLIEKGRGSRLKDIPNVAFKLSKRKPDDNLQTLHTILFGKKAKAHSLKRNIGQFSGYVWVDNEEKQRAKVKEKLDKCVKEKLMDFCDVLNIPINKTNVKKEEVSVKLLEFLESPHATTDVLLADKAQKGKKLKSKVTPSKSRSPGEASTATSTKKRKQTPCDEEQKHLSKIEKTDEVDDKVESSDTEGDSHEDAAPVEGSDHEMSKSGEEDDKPKEQMPNKKSLSKKINEGSGAKSSDNPTAVIKSTPAKSVKSSTKPTKRSSSTSKKGAADADGSSISLSKSKGPAFKKQKVEKENAKKQSVSTKMKVTSKPGKVLTKDQGKGKSSKKAKPEPSREEMHAVVVDILKEVDFNTATLSDILRKLGTHFSVDLMHRKLEVKDIITDVMKNMTDEEDDNGEEDEDNAEISDEGEEGEDNDGDGDGDA